MVEKTTENSDDCVLRIVSNQVFNSTSREFIELISSNFGGAAEEFNVKLSDFAEKVVHLG
ncbi:hypothetical protein J9303_16100 [Bacillaceae bacterium Marseille-Q3522]|nr:hypothetical protein [Bacillaceae bacterium Marseille-Q3522]